MSATEPWLDRFEQNHRNLRHPWLFFVAVPMVLQGTVGLLWNLPVPEQFSAISPLLNWGTAFLMVAMVYYFIISLPLALGMVLFVTALAAAQVWLQQSDYTPLRVAGGLLLAGLIGLWIGHRNSRALAALIEDLQTIMIGPIWLLAGLYRRIGIPI